MKKVCSAVTKYSHIPKHIIFLINEVPSFYGYLNLKTSVENYNKILDCTEWCSVYGVREVSFRIFSGIVFKFDDEAIEKMFSSFRIALVKWLHSEILVSKNIRFNVIDESSILPNHISKIIEIVQDLTKYNESITLNIIIGHDGEDKLNHLARTFQGRNIAMSLIKDVALSYTTEPQLIISNCSYKRLTDYLLWKTSSRCILNIHVPWNKFTLWHFVVCIVRFQFHPQNAKM